MSDYLSGKTQPRAGDISAIADALDVSADHLLSRADAECGLVPGRFLVDLAECENPSGKKDRFLIVEIPARPAIVDRAQARKLYREARKKLTGEEGDDESVQP